MKNKILDLFLYNKKLKFNEIEKSLKERSNKINYHLKGLLARKVLKKDGKHYELTENSECIIPYLSEKQVVVPVILIHIGDKEQAYLIKRNKRPYHNLLGLPGGRLILGETIKRAVQRIMFAKYGIKAKLSKINSISLDHIIKNKRIIHSFLLIFVSAKTKDKICLTNLARNKKKIINSDYHLIKTKLKNKQEIESLFSKVTVA